MGNISIEFGFENACAFGWDVGHSIWLHVLHYFEPLTQIVFTIALKAAFDAFHYIFFIGIIFRNETTFFCCVTFSLLFSFSKADSPTNFVIKPIEKCYFRIWTSKQVKFCLFEKYYDLNVSYKNESWKMNTRELLLGLFTMNYDVISIQTASKMIHIISNETWNAHSVLSSGEASLWTYV